MTSSPRGRRYPCRFCPETFGNHPRRKLHVDAAHPEQQQQGAAVVVAVSARPARPSLKRRTDVWPGRA